MSTYIHGVRIRVPQGVPESTDIPEIGWYGVTGSTSEFRWIADDISSYSPTDSWAISVLAREWCAPIEESFDGELCGGVSRVSENELRITNTVAEISQGTYLSLYDILSFAGLSFVGLVCEFVRFEIVSGALVAAGGTIVFRGILGDPKWSETEITIPVETAEFKRQSNLSRIIDGRSGGLYPHASGDITGQSSPLTFGEWDNAKLPRVGDQETQFTNINFNATATPAGAKYYPCVGKTGFTVETTEDAWIQYEFKISETEGTVGTGWVTPANAMFLKIIDGDRSGQTRRIDRYYNDGLTMRVKIVEVFEGGELAVTGATQSIATIFSRWGEYEADQWPCLAFTDETGAAITNGANLSVWDENQKTFLALPRYGVDIDPYADNNRLIINPRHFTGDPDSIDSWLVLPFSNFGPMSDATIGLWFPTISDWEPVIDGLYVDPSDDPIDTATDTVTGAGNECDLERATSEDHVYDIDFYTAATVAYCLAYSGTFPSIPDGIDFSEAYILARINGEINNVINGNCHIKILAKRNLIDTPLAIVEFSTQRNTQDIDCLAEFYCIDSPSTYNVKFFGTGTYPSNYTGTGKVRFYGYSNFEIPGVTNVDTYRSLSKMGILLYRDIDIDIPATPSDTIKFYELAVGFKRTSSIKSEVYSPFHGRIYDSTWGTRKTAANCITNPVDVVEHVRRLQNWSETGEAADWGHEYAAAPLIDVSSADGGFGNSQLTSNLGRDCRAQIFSNSDAVSGDIVDSVCRDFWMMANQDPATGNERLFYIGGKYTGTVSDTITLAHVVGEVDTVSQCPSRSLFCEPFIRYNWNPATNEFRSVISVLNSGESTYDYSYVTGPILTGPAEILWKRAHAIWGAIRKVQAPPADMTDKKWIYTDADAAWYLDTWLKYMGGVLSVSGTVATFEPKRLLQFRVPYSVGAAWYVGKKINVNFPSHTGGIATQGLICQTSKEIVAEKESVRVRVRLYNTTTDDPD